ncbi:hypothetical protein ACFWNH_31035 [Rhodococcus qingshengii]|uniref:hypothetical protein n=1 Tax=Rhodococcus qingshengii TaxID=334542 RepID=UPI003660E406
MPTTAATSSGFTYTGQMLSEIPAIPARNIDGSSSFSQVIISGAWSGESQTEKPSDINCSRIPTGSDGSESIVYQVRTSPFDRTDSGSDVPGQDYILNFVVPISPDANIDTTLESSFDFILSNPNVGEPNPEFFSGAEYRESFAFSVSQDLKLIEFSGRVDPVEGSFEIYPTVKSGIAGRIQCETIVKT